VELASCHPDAFQKVRPPRLVGFVSANSWDIQGAGAFGLRTCWLNRTGQAGDELGFSPDTVVKQLAEMAEMVGSQTSLTHK
jgi:2-haloacid dehalogenase